MTERAERMRPWIEKLSEGSSVSAAQRDPFVVEGGNGRSASGSPSDFEVNKDAEIKQEERRSCSKSSGIASTRLETALSSRGSRGRRAAQPHSETLPAIELGSGMELDDVDGADVEVEGSDDAILGHDRSGSQSDEKLHESIRAIMKVLVPMQSSLERMHQRQDQLHERQSHLIHVVKDQWLHTDSQHHLGLSKS
eukprot:FR735214.1.p1 GENE.FR735214.1~~FR735214.1.p1  ORF type:complete len:220 (+),score=16.17 FR735214.1:78-662(+)